MFLKINKKYFYYLLIIISVIFFFSCSENTKGQICIKNRCSYNIVNLKVGDTNFHTVSPYDTTSYKSFIPGSYKLEGTIDLTNDLFEDIDFDKTVQVNVLKNYTVKIRNDTTSDSYIVIVED